MSWIIMLRVGANFYVNNVFLYENGITKYGS